MSACNVHELRLTGCAPEPLMGYLKALGVHRLVAEQADARVTGCWRDGHLAIRSGLSRDELIRFLGEEYRPTPILAAWNGDGGFLSETGTSARTIQTLRESTAERLDGLRAAIRIIDEVPLLVELRQARAEARRLKKEKAATSVQGEVNRQIKQLKERILTTGRAAFPDEIVQWLDACLALDPSKTSYSPLLGSGGCDGRLEFSSNFLQNVIRFLELDPDERRGWVEQALFANGSCRLLDTAIGQFSPGQIGGPNATQGMEGPSLVNPLDFMLMVEGVVLFSGSVTRKLGSDRQGRGAFPFTVYASAVGSSMDASADSAAARGEIWMPVWERFTGLAELGYVLAEGRAELARHQARSGLQIARSIASLGVDRGIHEFARYGFLQRNGLAFLATPIGRIRVLARPDVDLLREIDWWLEGYRRAAGDSAAPPRFRSANRRVEAAIFEACQHGGASRFAAILCALGAAERELANGERFRRDKGLRPLCGLSPRWLQAADDGSVELELACALAGIHEATHGIGSLRSNLEPVETAHHGQIRARPDWSEETRGVVWRSADLVTNLGAVLERRLLNARRLGCEELPFRSKLCASLPSISAFVHRQVDDQRLAELLWGLVLINQRKGWRTLRQRAVEAPPLARSYALLRLLYLPFEITVSNDQPPVRIKPEARILPLLRSERLGEACRLAAQRLRASGLCPKPSSRASSRDAEWRDAAGAVDPRRLAAALLIPITQACAGQLARQITRREPETRESTAILQED